MPTRFILLLAMVACSACAFGAAAPCRSSNECNEGLRCLEGRCRVLATADAGAGDACEYQCPRPPEGCAYGPSSDGCSCGALICEDGGVETDACVSECPAPPEGCAYGPSPDGCSCGPLLCEDAGARACSHGGCGPGQRCDRLGCDGGEACVPDVPCGDARDLVCGCDGVTYRNDCARVEAGVALDRAGPCGEDCGAPGAGCCFADYDCASGERCLGGDCAAGAAAPGVCVPAVSAPSCFTDADCGAGETCGGARIPACGAGDAPAAGTCAPPSVGVGS